MPAADSIEPPTPASPTDADSSHLLPTNHSRAGDVESVAEALRPAGPKPNSMLAGAGLGKGYLEPEVALSQPLENGDHAASMPEDMRERRGTADSSLWGAGSEASGQAVVRGELDMAVAQAMALIELGQHARGAEVAAVLYVLDGAIEAAAEAGVSAKYAKKMRRKLQHVNDPEPGPEGVVPSTRAQCAPSSAAPPAMQNQPGGGLACSGLAMPQVGSASQAGVPVGSGPTPKGTGAQQLAQPSRFQPERGAAPAPCTPSPELEQSMAPGEGRWHVKPPSQGPALQGHLEPACHIPTAAPWARQPPAPIRSSPQPSLTARAPSLPWAAVAPPPPPPPTAAAHSRGPSPPSALASQHSCMPFPRQPQMQGVGGDGPGSPGGPHQGDGHLAWQARRGGLGPSQRTVGLPPSISTHQGVAPLPRLAGSHHSVGGPPAMLHPTSQMMLPQSSLPQPSLGVLHVSTGNVCSGDGRQLQPVAGSVHVREQHTTGVDMQRHGPSPQSCTAGSSMHSLRLASGTGLPYSSQPIAPPGHRSTDGQPIVGGGALSTCSAGSDTAGDSLADRHHSMDLHAMGSASLFSNGSHDFPPSPRHAHAFQRAASHLRPGHPSGQAAGLLQQIAPPRSGSSSPSSARGSLDARPAFPPSSSLGYAGYNNFMAPIDACGPALAASVLESAAHPLRSAASLPPAPLQIGQGHFGAPQSTQMSAPQPLQGTSSMLQPRHSSASERV